MELNIREAAKLLNATPGCLYRWIREQELPAHRVHDHYRFNRTELLEWAMARKISVSPRLFDSSSAPVRPQALVLTRALESGGIINDLPGSDLGTVIKELVNRLSLPQGMDRAFLLRMLIAREQLGSTGIGDGIAIPHVRNPIVLHVRAPMVTLAFLRQPVDFHAVDGKPVSILFTLVSPTVRVHLTLLSRLAFTLQDPALRQALRRQASSDAILGHIARIETQLALSEPSARKSHS
jgi:PTS system nitrogen regulatory IIA component